MTNTMNFSYMTRFCHDILQTCQVQNNRKSDTCGVGFQDKLLEKSEESEGLAATGKPDNAEMTMEEYKRYLYDRIASLPVNPSNMQDSISVHITEEGLEAMRNDPEYEQWVLDSLKTNFQFYDPWSSVCGGKFSVFYFGATKEESRGECWRLGFRNGNGERIFQEKAEDSFWERRKKRRKEWMEQLKELDEKKALARRMAKTEYYIRQSSEIVRTGEPDGQLSEDVLAMQIFSSLKIGVLLESFMGKTGRD